MSSSKSIYYTRIGLNKVQVKAGDMIHYFEGDPQDVEYTISMVKNAQNDPEELEKVKDYLIGKPSSFFGPFTINKEGELFFKDFAEPVSPGIAEKVKMLKETNDYESLKAIAAFQARLTQNRNKQAREDLYKFLEKNKLSITPKGYFVSYKAVARRKKKMDGDVIAYLHDHSFTVGTDYLVRVTRNESTTIEPISFTAINFKGNSKKIPILDMESAVEGYQVLGRVDALYNTLEANQTGCFVDKHTGTIEQNLGDVVVMPRAECDDNPANGCSYGLHVGSPEYVNNFASHGDAILIALVSPTDVIAVPSHDVRKMRVCQYFIAGFSKLDDSGKIMPVEDMLYENDFQEKELEVVQQELEEGNYDRYILPGEKQPNTEELRKIIQKRMVLVHETTM